MSRPGCARPVPSAPARQPARGSGWLWLFLLLGPLAAVPATPPADQRLLGTEHLAGFGRELAIGRFRPGAPLLVIAAPAQRVAGRRCGQVFFFPTGADGLDTNAATTLAAPAGSSEFGLRLATAGDVNGDGLDDLLVGAVSSPEDTNAPALVHLFTGSAAGLQQQPTATLRLPPRGSFRELRLAAAGDLDGDGLGDFAVGLPDLVGGPGELWIFLGRRDDGWTEPDQRIRGVQDGESFADALAGVGDVTGDGRADLLVGAPRWDGEQADEGRTVLFAGGPGGVMAQPAWEARCEVRERKGVDEAFQRLFGSVVATAGDVNGDGFTDVLVTAPFAEHGDVNEGLVLVYHGSARGLGRGPANLLEGNRDLAVLGGWAGGVGDVDGDGFDDVLAAAPELSDDQMREGAAFLFRGSPRGLVRVSSWSAEGNRSHEELGIPCLALGDVNGDGYADVAISGRHGWPDRSPGLVRIHYGTPAGLRGSAALSTAKPWMRAVDQEWRRLSLGWRLGLAALLALAFAAAGAAAHDWRRRRTVILVERRDTEARREERDRLARDLHDELGARLSRISLVTERLLHEAAPDAPATRFARVVSATATDLRQAMQALVGGLRHGPDTAGGVITMLEAQAGGLLQDTGVRLLRDLPDELPAGSIPSPAVTALRPGLREALGNVLRHAQATEVWLRVRTTEGELVVEVEDNGRGFEPALVPRRSGLRHLGQRAAEAGGRLELDSAPGQGTRVRFLLPLASSSTPS